MWTVGFTGACGPTLVSAGYDHSCALMGDKTVKCWGGNIHGELGDATGSDRSTAAAVSTLSGVTSIASGSEHACAVIADGKVRCWGNNDHGQLGDGTHASSNVPAAKAGWPVSSNGHSGGDLFGVVSIAGGDFHTCAVATATSGLVYCWGGNDQGQLGSSQLTTASRPVPILGLLPKATAVTAGHVHTCALLADGTVRCWGNNGLGQLGDGSTVSRSSSPVTVSGLSGVVALSKGPKSNHTCAVLANGTVQCWGSNHGQLLGPGTTAEQSNVPVAVPGLSAVASVTTGETHSCAVRTDGTVRCWGSGVSSTTPVAVPNLREIISAAAGLLHTCAVSRLGTVQCWGMNNKGQLGDGSNRDSAEPVTVNGL